MNVFLFDVDGTLTPSRGVIEEKFKDFFMGFCASNEVCLVTGSDYKKTEEQLGTEILEKVKYVFNCSGNDVWKNGINIYTNPWKPSNDVIEWLTNELEVSNFSLRTGTHIEYRPGCLNFSVVGRNANKEERLKYVSYDDETKEREQIALKFNNTFSDLYACVGGETGIDVFEKGKDKSQILKYFSNNEKLYFFGDKMSPGGNDYPLGKAILDSKLGDIFSVADWNTTYKILNVMKVI